MKAGAVLAALAILIAGWTWWGPGPLAKPATVTIREGSTLGSAARELTAVGAIRGRSWYYFGRILGGGDLIQAGEFEIPAHSSGASILDLLQTMPTFVYLGPIVLFFGIGSSAAVVCTLAYALPPIIRIAGHGIRNVSTTTIEATDSAGQTFSQRLVKVQLPMARATIVVGLNQTIMAALSMLVIAAMVGTRDLGQQVYVALGKADAGLGLVAGLSIALVAMISDRIVQNRFARK